MLQLAFAWHVLSHAPRAQLTTQSLPGAQTGAQTVIPGQSSSQAWFAGHSQDEPEQSIRRRPPPASARLCSGPTGAGSEPPSDRPDPIVKSVVLAAPTTAGACLASAMTARIA